MTGQEMIMAGSYDYRLVVLSIFISILAAYAARALAERVDGARGKAWPAWLVGGAIVNGIGIWSMHYTGMLSFRLPVPVEYDWPTVLLSLLMGIVGCAAALLIVSYLKMGRARAVAASLFFGGLGISGLHYTAMRAMRFPGMHLYSPPLVVLSIALAITVSLLALCLIFLFPEDTSVWRLRTHGSALLMGVANPVMHYTAMAATTFTYSAVVPDLSNAVSIWSLGILGNSVVPVMVLVVALLTSLADRLRQQKALLDELFEEMPEAMVLMNLDHTIIRVNREFTRLFGYSQQEASGRRLSDLIVPEEYREEVQRFSELVAQGQRVDVESVRQRKDDGRFPVDIVHVPVSLAAGQKVIYAIYRDITERKRAEEALQQARSRIESVLNSVADIHILFDRGWRYRYINEAAVMAIGRPREHILGRTLWEIYPDIVGTELERQYRRAMEERLPVAFDFHYLTLDTWWENRFYPSPEGLSVFATNITERKRVEEQLQQSDQRFRQLAESITEVFWMTDPDKQQVLYVSPGYEKIWGRPCESVYEQPTAWMDAIHPDDRPRVERSAMTQQVLGRYDEEYRIIRPDGSVRWIRDRAFPIKDTSGRAYRVTGIAEDITERKLAEEELKKEKEILEKIFDNIPVMIGFVGDDGGVKLVNPEWERTIGWTLKEIQEQNVDIFAEAYPDLPYRQKVRDFVAASTGEWVDLKIRVRDGQVIDAACAVVHLSDGTKVAIAQDITERKRAETELNTTTDQLRALSARLQSAREEEGTRIAREIHDELGSMLTSLKWDLDEINRILSTPMSQSQLAVLREKLRVLMKLTDVSVSALRRIASELRPSVLDDLGLAAAIEWQAQQFQSRTGIICDFDCSLENLELSDEQSTAVFRILQEALTNVLRHAQATKVDIRIKTEADYFVLVISDNGKGITEKEKAEQQSLGILGMRERAHLIGAEIDVKGIEGKGTVVTVRVPIPGRRKVLKTGQSMQRARTHRM
jgi:PAS domain S-box-containing protein